MTRSYSSFNSWLWGLVLNDTVTEVSLPLWGRKTWPVAVEASLDMHGRVTQWLWDSDSDKQWTKSESKQWATTSPLWRWQSERGAGNSLTPFKGCNPSRTILGKLIHTNDQTTSSSTLLLHYIMSKRLFFNMEKKKLYAISELQFISKTWVIQVILYPLKKCLNWTTMTLT